jgi:hypothetical protein
VELELRRHAWDSLQGAYGEARGLELAIRELGQAVDRDMAALAAERIEAVTFIDGLLSEAAVPVASCLVHCLWHCPRQSEDLILGILSDISGAVVGEDEPGLYGKVSVAEALHEVALGFSAYVEILETGEDINSRSACIDLILMCGLSNPRLRQRSIFFLQNALELNGLDERREVIHASIEELRNATNG